MAVREDSGNVEDEPETDDQEDQLMQPQQHHHHEDGARAQLPKAPRIKKYRALPRGVANRMLAALMRELGVETVEQLESKMATSECILVPRGRNLCHINPNSKRAVYILLFQALVFGYNYLCDDEFVEKGRKFIVPGCGLGAQRGSGRFPKDSIRLCINPCHYEIDYAAAQMIGFRIDRSINPRSMVFAAEQPYIMQTEGLLTTITRTDISIPRLTPTPAILRAGAQHIRQMGMRPGISGIDTTDDRFDSVIVDHAYDKYYKYIDEVEEHDQEEEEEDLYLETAKRPRLAHTPLINNRLRNALFQSVASLMQQDASIVKPVTATSSPVLKDQDAAQVLLSLFSNK